jgi:hypothetical protein
VSAPVAAPMTSTAPNLNDAPPTRKFWPAFWRFLFLLILLGVIVTGGIYLYLNYFTK